MNEERDREWEGKEVRRLHASFSGFAWSLKAEFRRHTSLPSSLHSRPTFKMSQK